MKKDIALILISAFAGFLIATSAQCVIPFFSKNIIHRNGFLNVDLGIIPETEITKDKDLVQYYFRIGNKHKDTSLEDINVRINFQSVIEKEVMHQNIGILGMETQKGESIKDSNHANITIGKIFPEGALIINYFIRKEQFGEPPFHVWNFKNNFCDIEYSYSYLGATIRRKIKMLVPIQEDGVQ